MMDSAEKRCGVPILSVVISNSNNFDGIRDCLDSVTSQAQNNIEIICVDDCSDDNSRQLIDDYASQNNKIRFLENKQHAGSLRTKANGVFATTGDYIMFLNGNSELASGAFEAALGILENYNPDILQFEIIENIDLNSENNSILSDQYISNLDTTYIQESNLLKAYWNGQSSNFSLDNKIIRGDICRYAFSLLEDGYFPCGGDLYAFFLITYYAHSLISTRDVFSIINSNVNIIDDNINTLKHFNDLLTEKDVYNCIERFINQHTDSFNDYSDILDSLYHQFLYDCVKCWNSDLNTEYLSQGFDELISTWGFKDILCMLAELDQNKEAALAEKILKVDCLHYQPEQIQSPFTIAAYYHSIAGGGAQRVVAELCNMWSEMRDINGDYLYNVILITDVGPQNDDYHLSTRVQREYLPDCHIAVGKNYCDRFDGWYEILTQSKIDFIISSGWVGPYTLWDLLSIRGVSPCTAFALHSHSFNCVPFSYSSDAGLRITRMYQLSDGVVTLSECDRIFAECFSSNVQFINNPLSFDPLKTPESTYPKNTLLWVGRIAKEKQPLDAIYMMYRLVQEIPDAYLYIVGDGDTDLYNEMQSITEKLNLQHNIEFVGFTQDVNKYYSSASILICTSMYEGFSLVFGEAMAHSIPIITYDMPWLSFIQDGHGIITVEQNRYDLLAKEAEILLMKPDECISLGKEGKQSICEMAKNDIRHQWETFISDTVSGKGNNLIKESNVNILFECLVNYQQIGRNRAIQPIRKRLSDVSEKNTILSDKLKTANKEHAELSRKYTKVNNKKDELLDKLKVANKEHAELSRKYTKVNNKKDELLDKLNQEKKEQVKLNRRLDQTQEENFRLIGNIRKVNKDNMQLKDKLSQTYAEKSEINRKLQTTYKEKYDRGVQIKEMQNSIDELRKEIDAVYSSKSFRLGHTLTWPVRKLRDLRK